MILQKVCFMDKRAVFLRKCKDFDSKRESRDEVSE